MITASIQFNSKSDLNKFMNELRKSVTHPWEIGKKNSASINKSFLKHKSVSFNLYFVDVVTDTIMRGRLMLGLFKNYIKIISVSVDNKGLNQKKDEYTEINIDDQYYSYILSEFIKSIKQLDSYKLVENKDLFVKLDLHQQVEDIRMVRPISIKDKKTGRILTLSSVEIAKVNRKTFEFVPPNNIALLLNISKRELELAQDLYNKKILKYFGNNSKCKYEKEKLSELYDYFEHIQTSLIFSYTAVEALCNVAIPDNYEFEIINSKGVKETWNKNAIERYLKTSDKLKQHLPNILDVPPPSEESFWSRFDNLEKIRNNLIHQKTKDNKDEKSAYQEEFLKETIFDIIYSGFELVEYFCNANTKYTFFPMGISNSDIEIVEVDDISNNFKKYEEN